MFSNWIWSENQNLVHFHVFFFGCVGQQPQPIISFFIPLSISQLSTIILIISQKTPVIMIEISFATNWAIESAIECRIIYAQCSFFVLNFDFNHKFHKICPKFSICFPKFRCWSLLFSIKTKATQKQTSRLIVC